MEQQGRRAKSSSPSRRKGFLAGIAADLAEFAGKGANLIAQEASKTINEAQRGIEAGAGKVQQGARARIGAGASRLQVWTRAQAGWSVLRNIERQIQDFQRQQQQRDLQSELEHHQKLPVDIQIGDQVYEDMPQEMRSRFWYVLLERPDLVQALSTRGQLPGGSGSATSPTAAGVRASAEGGRPPPAPAAAAATDPAAAGAGAANQAEEAPLFSAEAAAAAGTSGSEAVDNTSSSQACSAGNCAAVGTLSTAVTAPSAPSPWLSVHAPSSCNSSGSSLSRPTAPNPWELLQPAASSVSGSSAAAAVARGGVPGAPGAISAPAVASPSGAAGAGDGWEMVSEDVPSDALPAPGSSDTLQSLVERLSQASLDASRAAQASVFQAMLHEVPWMQGEGMPQDIDPHGEYAQLLAAGCGAVEDVIVRDVPRTFPEHPLFATQGGQQRLLRLLKAYATADPEVGYCQGMAFPAGVLLMYLPEEHAFRLFRRMMSSGPTLRRLYLPGLEFLQLELSRFELLLSTHAPQLHQHLLDAGLPALLYAAQWLMTCYACPFPMHVAARVIDVLLQAEDEAVLLRLGLAVMAALQQGLLELDDFEALITHLKVQPLSWPMHTHRNVLSEALHGPASNAELAAATAAVQAEFERLGRFSSFSSHQLAAQPVHGRGASADAADQGGSSGGVRLALVPGAMGPRTLASAAALDALEAAATASAGSSSSSEAGEGQQQQAEQQHQQHAEEQQQRGAEGSDRSVSVLCEMDAALIGLMQDMDLVIPPDPAAVDKRS
ncbi:rab-GTPase-TBC domain-containing protein [Scenedesmus sp. NREL 46B-D3]|nr:rab-GTPase-TBC domain-containing protein [Scenedesmus sp. NREL 46B-D3]